MSEELERIRVYNLPVSDLSNGNFEVNIYDDIAIDNGQSIVSFMRNRNLSSSWLTTESTDAANTTIEAIISDSSRVTDFFIVVHNFKNFSVEYWDGVAWIELENVVDNTSDFYHLEIADGLITIKMRVIVTGTMVADDDKRITRLIITEKMESGQFVSWPVIKKATQGSIKKNSKMLSGKSFISEAIGSYSVELQWKGITEQPDVDIIERMFLGRRAFMIWISGGSDSQFRFKLTGYRKQDFYIVKPIKDLISDYYKGFYTAMLPQTVPLVEVVD